MKELTLITRPLDGFDGVMSNNGFTVKVAPTKKLSHVYFEGHEYGLAQFHFHSPSEHKVDGDFFQIELHLVHESMTVPGKLLVIGIMFDESAEGNEFLDQILEKMPKEKGDEEQLTSINLEGLSLTGEFYRYDGSLTTPPCTEGVSWIVMKDIHQLTRKQYHQYSEIFPMTTNRPCQEVHGRVVKKVQF